MNAPLYEVLVWTGRVQYVSEERVEDMETIEALAAYDLAGTLCALGDETPQVVPASERQLLELPGGREALDAWRTHDYSHIEQIDAELVALDPLLH